MAAAMSTRLAISACLCPHGSCTAGSPAPHPERERTCYSFAHRRRRARLMRPPLSLSRPTRGARRFPARRRPGKAAAACAPSGGKSRSTRIQRDSVPRADGRQPASALRDRSVRAMAARLRLASPRSHGRNGQSCWPVRPVRLPRPGPHRTSSGWRIPAALRTARIRARSTHRRNARPVCSMGSG